MTKQQLRAEIFRIKNEIRDALLVELSKGQERGNTDLYQSMLAIWNEMNRKDYK